MLNQSPRPRQKVCCREPLTTTYSVRRVQPFRATAERCLHRLAARPHRSISALAPRPRRPCGDIPQNLAACAKHYVNLHMTTKFRTVKIVPGPTASVDDVRWLSIGRMLRVDRPTISTDRLVVSAMLQHLLRAIVMLLAQALQRPKPEGHLVASMRLDMIGDACGLDLALLQAHGAQRLAAQLSLSALAPAVQRVPAIVRLLRQASFPLRWSRWFC